MSDAIPFIDYLIEYNLSLELYSAFSLANFKPIKSLIVRFLLAPLKKKDIKKASCYRMLFLCQSQN
ncbi:hypothetical protein CW736_02465 [Nonlabens sp. MB-3u-79]|jgi:hypothetical protein|nr:hypothetical protein CW736_02465 [Nonlabens sp. MB-3u-79]